MNGADSLQAFAECVVADPALRERLATATDHARFTALCVELGAQRGCAFTAEELRQRLQQTNLAWLQRNLW